MRLIAFDPSSSLTGYATADNGRITGAGIIRPARPKDPSPIRLRDMRLDVVELIEEQLGDATHSSLFAVLEWPSSHVGARHGGGGAGLAVYGAAAGVVYAACLGRLPRESVVTVEANQWTRGRPKQSRLLEVKRAWPAWSREQDKGMDAADAIGLCLWWMDRNKLGAAT